jgi:molybdate transport system ATP-binding protein
VAREAAVLTFDAQVSRGPFAAQYRGELGALTAICGPSGSGKTTLLDMIAGLVPAHGTCVLNGTALHELPAHRRGIGYAFQDDRLFPHLTVEKNLLFAGRSARLEEILSELALEPLLRRRPHHLSGGEKRRVSIGRAILAAERLLLLDEPLSPLDGGLREGVVKLIAKTAVPVVVVSHEPLDAPHRDITTLRCDGDRTSGAPSDPASSRSPSPALRTPCAPPDRAP